MKSREDLHVFPYLTPNADVMKPGPWMRESRGTAQAVQEMVQDWDYNTPFHAFADVSVDVPAVREQCRLAEDSRIAVVAFWRSIGTKRAGAGQVLEVSSSATVRLQVRVSGALLAEQIQLSLHLVLLSAGSARDDLAPKQPGGLLLSAEPVTVVLEGRGSRFPTELVDFSTVPSLPQDAAWHLMWSRSDLNQPVQSSLRLLVNSTHPTMRTAISEEHATPESEAVLSAMYFSVGKALVEGALHDDDFVDEHQDYAQHSIGDAIHRLIRTLFPDRLRLRDVRQFLEQRPDSFDTELQARLRIFQPGP